MDLSVYKRHFRVQKIYNTKRQESKINSARNFISIRPLLIINYIGLLKMRLIDLSYQNPPISKVKIFKEYLSDQLDTSNAALELFSVIFYFSQKSKGLLKGSKDFNELLHHAWNAANDLMSFYVTAEKVKEKPVFASMDQDLANVLMRLKIKMALTNNCVLSGPFAGTEVNYEGLNIKQEHINSLVSHSRKVQQDRVEKNRIKLMDKLSGKKKSVDYDKYLRLLKDTEQELKLCLTNTKNL